MIKKLLKNNKGSTLTTVIFVMTILTVLGLGILSASLNNLKQTKSITAYEKGYYAGEAAVQQGIDVIKKEVSDYYMLMYNSTCYSNYLAKMDVFFQTVLANANSHFTEPDFKSDELSGSTSTVITMSPDAVTADVAGQATFTVTSTATIGNIDRVVTGTIDIRRAPINFRFTSAPIKTNDMLLLGGDVVIDREGNENTLTVVGHARIGGDVMDPTSFGATEGYLKNDATVQKDLNWKLFYNQFDKSIPAPLPPITVTPTPDPHDPMQKAPSISDQREFKRGWLEDANMEGEDIYFDGDIYIENYHVKNCNITATGNVTIVDKDSSLFGNKYVVENTNIKAGGNIFIEVSDIRNNPGNPRSYEAGGNITFHVGHDHVLNNGTIEYCQVKAGGNFYATSLASLTFDDHLMQSNIHAGGTIETGASSFLSSPTIDNVFDSFFYSVGNMTITSDRMYGDCKLWCRNDIRAASNGMDTCHIYADDDILFDASGFMNLVIGWFSTSTDDVLCAGDDITIKNSSFYNSYFYSGDKLTIDMKHGNRLENSILYAENDVLYVNDWDGLFDTIRHCLLYTNGDFKYSGRGTDITGFTGEQLMNPAGIQVMALDDLDSYEGDDSGGWLNPRYDWLRFGNGGQVDVSKIHDNIGDPNAALGILADELDRFGFEHQLPPDEVVKILPNYGDVFLNEDVSGGA